MRLLFPISLRRVQVAKSRLRVGLNRTTSILSTESDLSNVGASMWFEGPGWSSCTGSVMSNFARDLRLLIIASLIITRNNRHITPNVTPSTKYNTAFSLLSEMRKRKSILASNLIYLSKYSEVLISQCRNSLQTTVTSKYRDVARKKPGSTGFNISPSVFTLNCNTFKRNNSIFFCLPSQQGSTPKE